MTTSSRAFTAGHVGAKAGERLARDLSAYFQSFVGSWRREEHALQASLDQRREELAQGRKVLAVESAKLGQLRAKLRTLGESHNWKDLLTFLLEYGKATCDHLNWLEAASARASQ